MEQNNQNPEKATTDPPPSHVESPKLSTPRSSFRKRHGTRNILKVALFMMRERSKKSKALPVDDGSNNIWRKLVGSMRPLHLQGNQLSPPQPQIGVAALPSPSENNFSDYGEDGFDSASEFSNSPASLSSSCYASAIGLNEMVKEEEGEEKEEHDDGGGDEMIDAKAEEFIAEFYLQMRLQHMDSMEYPGYREISQRSLGL